MSPADDAPTIQTRERITGESATLIDRYLDVRRASEALAVPLSAEDQQAQSMPDASPVKWHLAHTSWFFETFLLIPHLRNYRPFNASYWYLFNSYYEAVGPRHPRPARGLLSRPSAAEIGRYRAHVDAAMEQFFQQSAADTLSRVLPLITLGCHHEEQHQELILMDVLHLFAQSAIKPAYGSGYEPKTAGSLEWVAVDGEALAVVGTVWVIEAIVHLVVADVVAVAVGMVMEEAGEVMVDTVLIIRIRRQLVWHACIMRKANVVMVKAARLHTMQPPLVHSCHLVCFIVKAIVSMASPVDMLIPVRHLHRPNQRLPPLPLLLLPLLPRLLARPPVRPPARVPSPGHPLPIPARPLRLPARPQMRLCLLAVANRFRHRPVRRRFPPPLPSLLRWYPLPPRRVPAKLRPRKNQRLWRMRKRTTTKAMMLVEIEQLLLVVAEVEHPLKFNPMEVPNNNRTEEMGMMKVRMAKMMATKAMVKVKLMVNQ